MKITKQYLHRWCKEQVSTQLSLLKTLASIPAPSHQEDRRAEFIQDWLLQQGAKGVMIDPAKNVILHFGNSEGPTLVCMAHTDVVFPDTDPLPVREESGRLYAPGVGDDTANVTALLLCAKFLLSHPEAVSEPLLMVFNSCEEGLGNLKGVRQIMKDYAGRVRALVSFDCCWDAVISQAVGSERWQVTVKTRGGHSFSDFGNPNAIVHLSRLIDSLYRQPIPKYHGSKTTYNVGLISGGTSVNTIAQSAQMTYEYRSDHRDCLAAMACQFHSLVQQHTTPDVEITVTGIGQRPCGGDVPEEAHQALLSRCRSAVQMITGFCPPLRSASTDANIPLSLGIPAATFGLYLGGGAHTREEYVEISSLTPGLEIALNFFLHAQLEESMIDNLQCT